MSQMFTKSQILNKLKSIYSKIELNKEKNKIFNYNKGKKIHQKQIEFHKSIHKNRWVFGGNRTGKTECGAVEVIYLARGIHPFRKNKECVKGWVVSLTTQVQRDVAQNKILQYLNPDWIVDVVMNSGKKNNISGGVIDYIVIKNVSGKNSIIGFKSCDQKRERFQGTSLDFVWFDEEPPYDIYLECKMRVLDTNGDIFGTMTPLLGLTWVYNEIYLNDKNDKNVWHITMSWEDNPFLDKNVIQQLSQSMSSEELNSRKYGNFASFGGLVYGEFNPSVHVIEPFDVPREYFDMISIDPGLKNPLSCHWYAVDFDDNVYVIAEHYQSEKDIDYHSKKINEICDNLKWPRSSNGMIVALIDSAANQQTLSGSKSVCELFYEKGILTNSKVNKDLFSGISRVKQYLKGDGKSPKLFIFSNCTNLIREIKAYTWSNNDTPIKKDDHALDELRYYLMTKPNKTKIEEKSEILRNKELLIKKLKRRRQW